MTINRITPEAAKKWTCDTIAALVPTEDPSVRWSLEPQIFEDEDLPTGRGRIFGLFETGVGPSSWTLGGSLLRGYILIAYVRGRNQNTTQAVKWSDIDQLQQTLENRSSWTSGIVGIQVAEATILPVRENATHVLVQIPIVIDYLPKGI